jgi:mannose-6-phosphate isomerase-like protein (cupin superfamily)
MENKHYHVAESIPWEDVRPGFRKRTIWEDEQMNRAEIELTAPYPPDGKVCANHKSTMYVRILDGSVTLYVNSREIRLSAGDMAPVPPCKYYYWSNVEKVTMDVVSIPPWRIEDHTMQ